MAEKRVIVGIVGYSAVVDSYPLGPKLMEELEVAFAEYPEVVVENFTWSPVHIVQRFQDGGLERPDRIIGRVGCGNPKPWDDCHPSLAGRTSG